MWYYGDTQHSIKNTYNHRKMPKILFYVLLLTSSAIAISAIKGDSSIKDLSINLLAAALVVLLEKFIDNYRLIWIWLVTNTWLRRKKIRFSVSYLFKIKLSDKYLLVKGKRIANQYQPVGGVFKRYRESFYALESLKVTDDDNIPIDNESIDDLRIKLPAPNAIPFIKWYDSQLGREVSPYREFYEELIRPGIVTQSVFPYINYIHKRRHMTAIRFSNHFQCHEILIAEIFELKLNEPQIEELKKTMDKSDTLLIWVKEDEINRLGAIPGRTTQYTISETSKWVL